MERAEHHPTRRGHGLHALGQADLFADRGVPGSTRADLPGDHLPGVQPDPQLKIHTVPLADLLGQITDGSVDVQGGPARPQGVVLQGERGTEDGHDPVAGELVQRAAVAAHHRRCPVEQPGHDLPQPLGPDRLRDVHRMHDVGEQHRHLLVLGHPG